MGLYAIIDIETTGLSPAQEKITEISVILHDGQQETSRYTTLLNPEKKIPYRITQMTGISNKMVEDAPRFYEVAKKLVELTENRIIVGHNVRFDYGFIRSEFKSLGYDYQRQTLDTIRLARKLIPGMPSYGLGNLCKALHIDNHARHRAEGDALATTQLFELLLSMEETPEQLNLNGTQSSLSRSIINDLPRSPGVYYFYNRNQELIYVGKSINIHDRVMSHLNNHLTKKAVEMRNAITDVQFKLTGNDLVAQLLESHEIKQHQPLYNRAQRRTFFNYGLYSYFDDNGYLNLKVMRIVGDLNPLYTYSSAQEGHNHLEQLTEHYSLCQKLCGVYDSQGPCFHYQIKQCHGACVGEEPPQTYNTRVQEALNNYHFDHQNFLIVAPGRNEEERSIIKVWNGCYKGFGFVNMTGDQPDNDALHDCIQSYPDNREVRRIINSYLRSDAESRLIVLSQTSDS